VISDHTHITVHSHMLPRSTTSNKRQIHVRHHGGDHLVHLIDVVFPRVYPCVAIVSSRLPRCLGSTVGQIHCRLRANRNIMSNPKPDSAMAEFMKCDDDSSKNSVPSLPSLAEKRTSPPDVSIAPPAEIVFTHRPSDNTQNHGEAVSHHLGVGVGAATTDRNIGYTLVSECDHGRCEWIDRDRSHGRVGF